MAQHKDKEILITGHSLGAALGQLCAIEVSEYMQEQAYNGQIYLYTFGSPRWGNKVMVKHFASLVAFHYRVVNEKDVVPTLPYEDLGLKSHYHHSWTEIWYKKDSPLKFKECDGSGEDSDCDYIGYSISDHLHYMGIYEDCS